jgi:hypothetical protein
MAARSPLRRRSWPCGRALSNRGRGRSGSDARQASVWRRRQAEPWSADRISWGACYRGQRSHPGPAPLTSNRRRRQRRVLPCPPCASFPAPPPLRNRPLPASERPKPSSAWFSPMRRQDGRHTRRRVVCSGRYTRRLNFCCPHTVIYPSAAARYGRCHAEPRDRSHLGLQAAFRGGSRRARGHLT